MRADQVKINRLLKTARGQIDGVLKMIEENQYCLDIANQIMAAEAILRKANKEIIKAHMEGCVLEAFSGEDPEEKRQKIEEILAIMDKLAK